MRVPKTVDWLQRKTTQPKHGSREPESVTRGNLTEVFADFLYQRAREGIRSIPAGIASDIYALSLYHWEDEDDPRRSILTVGYNTTARWRECTPAPGQESGWPIASDSDEAKWNFAFWLQDEGTACVIGDSTEDEAARREWIASMGLWYSDEDEEEDWERVSDRAEQVQAGFVLLCVGVGKRLHDEGVIIEKFGRAIPVLVHELEYYDMISEATRRANPPELTIEFEQWIEAMKESG